MCDFIIFSDIMRKEVAAIPTDIIPLKRKTTRVLTDAKELEVQAAYVILRCCYHNMTFECLAIGHFGFVDDVGGKKNAQGGIA
jgi:hypothetical protein